ncbi:oocyte zinc finger protein XlCOF20-like [Betta splendens]|uniref:Oocyte zinc finger protein XlCOF20-like n=1 Tax=Betta splendens TaxID=158456 RepID=A0A6P7L1N8_BETSP|nr:oocyte zinc finger protein XlCOF20-like [Betta splendens]
MSSVQHLKEFISQRLTAAAVEIFGAFEQTIVEYEEELDRQRRLLDAVLRPEIKLHRIETPDIPDVCEEDRQISHHVKKTSQDEDDPNPLQIKEEHEEPRTSEEEEALVLKQETDNVMSSAYEDNAAEANGDSQLLSHSSLVTLDVDNSSMSKTHTDKIIFMCTTCGRTFKGKGALQTHVKTHTKQHLICNTCGKEFLCSSALKTHVRIHTGEKPFLCKTCGKRYKQKPHLEAHIRIHTGEKPFPCKICGKRFRQQSQLGVHLRSHTGEKPYACKRCGKHYRSSTSLTVHTRNVHTGERPLLFNVCGQSFFDSRTLKQHMMVHTGESPIPVKHVVKVLQVVKPC